MNNINQIIGITTTFRFCFESQKHGEISDFSIRILMK